MQKVTGEHSHFLNLQNRKFHFWERERGRVNERPNLLKRDFVVTDFLRNWGDTGREVGSACSLPSAGDRSNIFLGVPRSNHKEQGKFKDNIIK